MCGCGDGLRTAGDGDGAWCCPSLAAAAATASRATACQPSPPLAPTPAPSHRNTALVALDPISAAPMRYLRFLKPPRVAVDKASPRRHVVALVTISSDLGDSFLPHSVQLSAELWTCEPSAEVVVWSTVQWTAGLRSLLITLPLPTSRAAAPLRLRVGVVPKATCDDFGCLSDPGVRGVVSAWSSPFTPSVGAAKLVERRFRLLSGEVSIWEETGESIARHLWYHDHNLLNPLPLSLSNVGMPG